MTHDHCGTTRPPVHCAPRRNPRVGPEASILIGDQLIDRIGKNPPGKLIGVRIATFAGYVTVGLDAAVDDGPRARRERVFTRALLSQSRFAAGAGLDEMIEQGIVGICGAAVTVVHRDGRHWLAVEAASPSASGPTG